MPKRKPSNLSVGKDFGDWLSVRLQDPKKAAEYLNAASEDGSPEALLLALRDIAEARRMSEVAKGIGVSRETIYRMLSKKGNPRFDNMLKLLHTIGVQQLYRPLVAGSSRSVRSEPTLQRVASVSSKSRRKFTAPPEQMRLSFGSSISVITKREGPTVMSETTASSSNYATFNYDLPVELPVERSVPLPAYVINQIREETYASVQQ